jgi:translation initiation factor 2B subunit (eIF-2B alpha/beta/delta family)
MGPPGSAGAWAEVHAVASDRLSGAAELAQRAAAALVAVPAADVPAAIETLLRGHPCMGPLWNLAAAVLSAEDPGQAVGGFIASLERDAADVAQVAAAGLASRIMTISYTSTVVRACSVAVARRPVTALCLLSEPEGEGVRMAAALRSLGIAAEVVADADGLDRVAWVGAVVVGADAVTPSGVVNKAGTGALALAARQAGVPCLVLAGSAKLVGAEVPVVPPFELMPLDLATGVAAGGRFLSPAEASAAAASRGFDAVLGALLEQLCGGAGNLGIPKPAAH